jgi:hypothetical protein
VERLTLARVVAYRGGRRIRARISRGSGSTSTFSFPGSASRQRESERHPVAFSCSELFPVRWSEREIVCCSGFAPGSSVIAANIVLMWASRMRQR